MRPKSQGLYHWAQEVVHHSGNCKGWHFVKLKEKTTSLSWLGLSKFSIWSVTVFPKGKYFPFASLISKNPYGFWFHRLLASSYSKVLSLAIQQDKWKSLGQKWLLDSPRWWQNTSSVRKDEDTGRNLVSTSAIPLSVTNSENDYTDANSSCLICQCVCYKAGVRFPPSWVNRGHKQAKSKSGSRSSWGSSPPAVRRTSMDSTYLFTSLGHVRCSPAQEGCQRPKGTRQKATAEIHLPEHWDSCSHSESMTFPAVISRNANHTKSKLCFV